MKHRNLWLVVLLLLGASSPALAQHLDLGTALQEYKAASDQFATTIFTAAKALAVTLGVIDFSLLILQKLIKSEGPQEIMVAVIMRVMWYGFLAFLMNTSSVMAAIINGFLQLGKNASGISVFNPADVFWQGIDLVNIMTTTFADGANIAGVPVPAGLAAAANPLVAFMLGITIILIVLSFLILTAQYAVILVQMYFYLACYPIIVAMGGIKYGRDMTTKAISGAIVIGVRFLAIYFVLYAAQKMATTMGQQLAKFSIADMSPMWAVFGMSGLLAFLALKVPQMAADLMGGTASLSGGDAVAAAAVAAGAAGAVAGGAAAVAKGTANGVAGAMRAGQSAISQARERGATGLASTAAGAAGAMGNTLGEAAMESVKGLGSKSAGGRLAERIDNKTASIREANVASSVSAPAVPGGQPPAPSAPAAPAAGDTSVAAAPAAGQDGGTLDSQIKGDANRIEKAQADGGDVNAAADKRSRDSEATRATPPAPAGAAATPSPSAAPTSGTASSTQGDSMQPAAPASSGGLQDASRKLADNLVNELKQADQVQGAAINIHSGGHE